MIWMSKYFRSDCFLFLAYLFRYRTNASNSGKAGAAIQNRRETLCFYNRGSQLEAHRIWIEQFSLPTEKLAGSEANHVVLLSVLGAGCTVSCVCLSSTGSAHLP